MIYAGVVQLYCLSVFEGGALGTIHDHEVSVTTERRRNGVNTIVNYLFTRPLSEDERNSIRSTLESYHATPEFAQKDTLVRLPFSDALYSQKVKERVDITLFAAGEAFKSLGLVQYEGCALCELPGFDQLTLIRGIAMRTHDACYEKLMADVAEHYRKLDSSTEHLGKGYVWAVAGLFLGAFVNFLINVYSAYTISYFYALVPVAGLGFYRLAQAPLRREIPIVMGTLSVIAVAAVVLLVYWVYAGSWGLTLSVFLLEGIEDEPDVMNYFVKDMLYGIAAAVIGVSVMWSLFHRSRRK